MRQEFQESSFSPRILDASKIRKLITWNLSLERITFIVDEGVKKDNLFFRNYNENMFNFKNEFQIHLKFIQCF